jgi:hypothetical protein
MDGYLSFAPACADIKHLRFFASAEAITQRLYGIKLVLAKFQAAHR